MQCRRAVRGVCWPGRLVATYAAVAALAAGATQDVDGGVSFGPGGCVSAARSAAGTCVLRTNCSGRDLSGFDFAFTCVGANPGVTKHSLGVGSFDEVDELDSEVKCEQCLPPVGVSSIPSASNSPKVLLAGAVKAPRGALETAAPEAAAGAAAGRLRGRRPRQRATRQAAFAPVSALQVPEHSQAASEAKAVQHYGPGMCVSTWRDTKTGRCQLQTSCFMGEDIGNYVFGFLCMDSAGELTRHLFGRGTFALNETFDTQTSCERCLAADDKVFNSGVVVDALQREVEALRKQVLNLSLAINNLNEHSSGAASRQKGTVVPAPWVPKGAPVPPFKVVHHREYGPAPAPVPAPVSAPGPVPQHGSWAAHSAGLPGKAPHGSSANHHLLHLPSGGLRTRRQTTEEEQEEDGGEDEGRRASVPDANEEEAEDEPQEESPGEGDDQGDGEGNGDGEAGEAA